MVYKKSSMIPNFDRPYHGYPFHCAAEFGFLEICEMIMENMEDKNPKNNSWVTPLHEAAQRATWKYAN